MFKVTALMQDPFKVGLNSHWNISISGMTISPSWPRAASQDVLSNTMNEYGRQQGLCRIVTL